MSNDDHSRNYWACTHTCSALTTSMITPPFIILARPALTAKLFVGLPSPLVAGPWPLVVGSLEVMIDVEVAEITQRYKSRLYAGRFGGRMADAAVL